MCLKSLLCLLSENVLLLAADTRRSLHLRLGLPLDRPLLRIANALSFKSSKMNETSNDAHLELIFLIK